jgi:hypothetical protein
MPEKKEMDTQERRTSKLDTMETTFMNCLSAENNGALFSKKKKETRTQAQRAMSFCCYVVHS